ncbi:MAG TPA: hypothetical protein VGD01_14195 [Candidatus Elarobacter sp.]|jgi:hypothetical protein
MAIEFLSESAVLEDRLASLEDPSLAERLAREHPELFPEAPPELPRTQRQVLAWATRRVGTAVVAVTAAVSIVAGYFGSESLRHPARAPVTPAAQGSVAAAPPLAKPPARRQVARPAAHHTAPVAHHAAPVAYHAPAVVHHAAPVVQYVPVAHPRPDRQAQLLRARLHAQEAEIARLRAQAAAERAAAQTARAQARAQQRAAAATAPASAARSRPQTDPAAASATATQSATSPNTRTEPGTGTATGTPVDAPLPNGGTRTPPTNTGGGGWSEHPSGGTMGGFPPIPVGVPRDPCTPRGGRTGAILQAVQAVQIIQSLSRQH